MVALVLILGSTAAGSIAHAKSEKIREFTFYGKADYRDIIDVGPSGPSVGDKRIWQHSLYSSKEATTPIGHAEGVSEILIVDPESGIETRSLSMVVTLKRGEIQVAGIYPYDPDVQQIANTRVVTGDTGAFFGTRGVNMYEALGDNWFKYTYRLVD